eukprot:2885508-Amphidinium_carterae.1
MPSGRLPVNPLLYNPKQSIAFQLWPSGSDAVKRFTWTWKIVTAIITRTPPSGRDPVKQFV